MSVAKPRFPCPVCGKLPARPDVTYCSSECYHKARTGVPTPARMRRGKNICEQCGKEFEVGGRSRHRWETRFCSKECRGLASRKLVGSGAWRRISTLVIDRDKMCILCGKPENLQSHHILLNGERAHKFKGDVNLEELAALCRPCHSAVERISKLAKKNNPDFDLIAFINSIRIR